MLTILIVSREPSEGKNCRFDRIRQKLCAWAGAAVKRLYSCIRAIAFDSYVFSGRVAKEQAGSAYGLERSCSPELCIFSDNLFLPGDCCIPRFGLPLNAARARGAFQGFSPNT
jgi:hypothetical protein